MPRHAYGPQAYRIGNLAALEEEPEYEAARYSSQSMLCAMLRGGQHYHTLGDAIAIGETLGLRCQDIRRGVGDRP